MKPAKAYFNVLRLRINVALKRTVLNNYPVIAYIDPTSSYCPLRCPGCPTGLRLGLRKPHMLEWELYKCLIDEIGDCLFDIELYNWGEPLLHKQTPEFIEYAKSKDIKVVVHTNMSIKLSDEYIGDLVKSGLDKLVVSLDGATQETYEKYRRGGDLSLVRTNMLRIQAKKRALGFKTPEINWKFIVFRHNEHEIATVKTTYRDWGADSVVFAPPFMDFKMLEEGFEYATIPDYNPFAGQGTIQTKVERKTRPRQCLWLYEALVLNSDGSVSPCCGISDEKDDFAKYQPSRGFFSAWNSDRFRMARSVLSKSMLSAPEDKLDKGMIICRKCPAGFNESILAHPEDIFRQVMYERASLFLQTKDMRYLPDFLLRPWISDCSTAIRNLLQLFRGRLYKGKSQ